MRIDENFDLTLYNSYRIRSRCKRAFFPSNENEFITIFEKYGKSNKVILGGGYNVILSKEFYKQDFILIGDCFSKVEIIGGMIIAEAGINLKTLSELALENGLTKMEMFYDIPSSLGGAVVMNAGASGEEIKDILLKVRYLDLEDLSIKEMEKHEMEFEYRNSFFQKNKNCIILKVWLQLENGDVEEIKKKMDTILEARWAKQPKNYPNAGSVFKRPKGYYVGALIDELNLKGYKVGGAKVSEKHGGFIINYDNAKGQDILDVITHIKKQVMDNIGVNLEVEQRII